ncbi:hypothetical protein [Mesorhizobium sp. WSM3860]|uniref:hypothetical protein n=1 Tax=Mesorhizobium sp. WSM3860 TaxID=2029403 RepID=UPI001140B8FE|nr:hypothetical protein [Mesorhizobium sp. WSM3860]
MSARLLRMAPSVIAAVTVARGAHSETPKEAYEACLAAAMNKILPTNCGRPDVIARMIAFQCNQQLLALVGSMPSAKTVDMAALPVMGSPDETEEITAYLGKHWVRMECIINQPMAVPLYIAAIGLAMLASAIW